MKKQDLKANLIISGPIFPEPVQVMMTHDMGNLVKVIGKGLRTDKFYDPILDADQLDTITASPEKEPFDGDPVRFRLGIEGMRLGLAYEYDPYFALSIARVDPLPHQLEAVYDYFLKLPRIRFLLADDPGAGKTIMAGLLIKELKIRGLAKRTLIVTPGQSLIPVATRAEGQVPRKFRGHPKRRSPGELWIKPVAGKEPGHYLGFVGFPRR